MNIQPDLIFKADRQIVVPGAGVAGAAASGNNRAARRLAAKKKGKTDNSMRNVERAAEAKQKRTAARSADEGLVTTPEAVREGAESASRTSRLERARAAGAGIGRRHLAGAAGVGLAGAGGYAYYRHRKGKVGKAFSQDEGDASNVRYGRGLVPTGAHVGHGLKLVRVSNSRGSGGPATRLRRYTK